MKSKTNKENNMLYKSSAYPKNTQVKSKLNIEIILLIIVSIIFLIIAVNISSRMNGQLPSYSIENKSNYGGSIFYEAMKKLGYPVEKSLKPIYSEDTSAVQIVIQDGRLDINDEKIKSWIGKGGKLVILMPDYSDDIPYGTIKENDTANNITIYEYNKGFVITAKSKDIANITLTKDTKNAFQLVTKISKYSAKKIYFNENNLYAQNSSLWDYIPYSIKIIIYQVIIVLIAYFSFKGKRFGKIEVYAEEEERIENEYLYSAAALFRQAKCWNLMIENYYNSFLKIIRSSDNNWIDFWENEKLPNLNKAKKVYKFIHDNNKKVNSKEYFEMIKILDELIMIAKNRRDIYWKTLKTTIQ
ncbi:MAG: DUF4350 domain-containing protein [Bacillota bacterium]|nr:DUF4350 domain-containing protein [Bacillota bacterium]